MRNPAKVFLPVLTIASLASTTGCFFELNGAVMGTTYTPPSGVSSPDPISKSGYGIGLNFGVAYDHERKVRGALFAGLDGLLLKTEGGTSGSSTASGIGGRVDYSVLNLGSGDDTKLRVTGGLLYGTSKKVSFNSVDVKSDSFIDVHGGATLALFGGDASSVMLTLGPKYIKSSGDYGSIAGFGLHASVTYTWTPFGGSSSGESSGCPENVDGMCAFRSELPDDTNVIPALVVGALGAGCKAGLDGQKMAAQCPNGNVLAVQNGRVVVRACEAGLPGSTCRAIWSNILSHVPHD